MSVTAQQILNTIRDNASDEFIARVPAATLNNLAQVGDAITANSNIMNEFITAIINKVAQSNIKSKMYNNPLKKLKSNGIPYGSTIEELFVNPATDGGYDSDGTKLLKSATPDGKSAYYGLNRKGYYPTTVNIQKLQQAFLSAQAFMQFYNAIVATLYSGDNIDEFTLAKKMLGKAVDGKAVKIIPSDIEQPKELSRLISQTSKMFTFPNTEFCGYNLVNADKILAGEKKCITFCPLENQVLFLRVDAETKINYEFLANAFNLDLVSMKAMTILVDDIPSESYDVYAMLVDKESVQIIDKVYQTESFYNGSNLDWKLMLHHWQWLYLSMFGNAVAFAKEKVVGA